MHFDAHADTAMDQWGSLIGHGQPMRRLIDEGGSPGRTSSRSGFRGYWPDRETFVDARAGLRWHTQVEMEERGVEAVIDEAIAQALDGPDRIYLSVDIDVVDPGMAPGTGTPESGGMLGRELLRAVRRIAGPWTSPGWTSWRSPRRTTTRRSRRCSRATSSWRRSARSPPPGLKGRRAVPPAMCRSIKRLREPHGQGYASEEEIREAARQFVRKVSGFGTPSSRHVEAFEAAVDEVTDSSRRLLETIDATLRSTA